MKQSRIVVAGTLAAAWLAFGGSSATVAAAEKSRTLRGTGNTRNVACRNAEARVSARQMNLGHTILNQDGCRCTVERETDYSGITREDWTCEIKFTYRTGPSEAELERRRQHEEFVERTERENRRIMREALDTLHGTDR